jgi:carbonic anhydrase/acetyltransferase-like protein (isoleucine patch superfamily)
MALIRELLGKIPKIGENTFLAETAVIIGCTVLHSTGILPISDIAVMGCDCDVTQ